MADDDLDRYLRDLPFKMKRRLAGAISEQADRVRVAIEDAAPRGTSGKLAGSVQVRRGRGTLELVVTAGGAATTKQVRKGSGTEYDYSLAVEFGNEHVPAQPFFYSTWNDMRADVAEAIADAVGEVIGDSAGARGFAAGLVRQEVRSQVRHRLAHGARRLVGDRPVAAAELLHTAVSGHLKGSIAFAAAKGAANAGRRRLAQKLKK
jgi:hypothetical protein